MPFVILSYCEHITGICDIQVLHRFANQETACAFFDLNRQEFVDENPKYFLVAEELKEGYRDLTGNWLR